jgi:hypothetical protein
MVDETLVAECPGRLVVVALAALNQQAKNTNNLHYRLRPHCIYEYEMDKL